MITINDLTVKYNRDNLIAVGSIRLKIPEKSIFAIVGESGCGKTTLGLSICSLINPRDGRIESGSVVIDNQNILRLSEKELLEVRGRKVSYIFQEPASSLNPVFTIGTQIEEALLIHNIVTKNKLKEATIDALKEARLDDPERVYSSYPHQLSGGMKQRAMIAMAISTKPELLICDEPTTALDVDTEAEILDLLLKLRDELSLSVLFITHNMRILERIADYIAVMYKGKVVEVDEKSKIFTNPRHEYTKLLLNSMPEKLKLL